MKLKKFYKLKLKQNRGFTLIELLVTITIFVVLTGVVLFSQTGFNNTILLKNLAYDVALTIRQAQSYGVNVNESQVVNAFVPFGVYFNLSNSVNGSNKNFIFFSDTVGNDEIYNTANVATCSNLECIQKYNITNGDYIKGICVTQGSSCVVGPSSPDMQVTNDLTILFTRPNPNAIITATDSTGTRHNYNYADIQVASPSGGQTKDIIVTGVGQIYVQ